MANEHMLGCYLSHRPVSASISHTSYPVFMCRRIQDYQISAAYRVMMMMMMMMSCRVQVLNGSIGSREADVLFPNAFEHEGRMLHNARNMQVRLSRAVMGG